MEDALFAAVHHNRVKTVSHLLRVTPTLNINHRGDHGWTVLHRASMLGHSAITHTLLQHHGISVNQQDDTGCTAILLACSEGETEVVKVLLRDHRVDIESAANDGVTPLWCATLWGYLPIIKWILVLRHRAVDLEATRHYGKEYSLVEFARKNGKLEIADLLDKFTLDPQDTRFNLAIDLGLRPLLAAELFASVVLLCDDFLRIREGKPLESSGRFFRIASQLPMELQMVLCRRVYDLGAGPISVRDTELAFRSLAAEDL